MLTNKFTAMLEFITMIKGVMHHTHSENVYLISRIINIVCNLSFLIISN